MIATILLAMMMLACGAPRGGIATETARTSDDFKERDEINRTFQLAPGAHVEVSSIRGPVEIVNTDSATAEVQIVRTARTRADLDYHKISIEQTGTGLVIEGVQEPEHRQRENIRVNHHVKLKLPRRIDLAVSSISGPVSGGDVDGQTVVQSISGSATFGDVGGKLKVTSISGDVVIGTVGGDARVNSVSGDVRVSDVNGSLDVNSVSGRVKVTLASLSTQGIHVNSVTGSVELAFKSDVNADFTAQSINGNVDIDVPNATRDTEVKPPNARARIGTGGTPITVTSVTGNVRLTRS